MPYPIPIATTGPALQPIISRHFSVRSDAARKGVECLDALPSPLLLLVAPALGQAASAAQQELDTYFAVLQQVDSPAIIRDTENKIWEIWMSHEDENAERLLIAGIERMNNGQHGPAMLAFDRLIEFFPDYMEAWNKRATLHYLLGNFDASIKDIEQTLALEPRHFGALSGLSLIYIQRDELTQARDVLEELLLVHPNSPNARQNLELVLERLASQVI